MNCGDHLGDHEIISILGVGGMGEVYKARNVHSQRIEALKVLRQGAAEIEEAAERFEREIRILGALDHPYIARLLTASIIGGDLVMVMEFVEGVSLETLLRSGPLDWREVVEGAKQLLVALEYAHSIGVVHRDLKPANIVRAETGVFKLLDFGIARMRGDIKLTKTGLVIGSYLYMSPEQIKGDNALDCRSDIYSFGILLYEMATGVRPFEREDPMAILHAHLNDLPVVPSKIAPSVPRSLSDIIMRAVAKLPGDRFQSAREMLSELMCCDEGSVIANRFRRRTAQIVTMATAAVLITTAAVAKWPRTPPVAAEPVGVRPATTPIEPLLPASNSRWGQEDSQRAVAPTTPSRQLSPSTSADAPPVREAAASRSPAPLLRLPAELSRRLEFVQARVDAMDARLARLSQTLEAEGLSLRESLDTSRRSAIGRLSQARTDAAAGRFAEAGRCLDEVEASLSEIEQPTRK